MAMKLNISEDDFRERLKRIKAIAMDLDDTLLDSDKNISPRNYDAIKKAQEKGLFVTICTARDYNLTQGYAMEMGIKGLYSAVSGCQIVDTESYKVVESHSMDIEECIHVVEFCSSMNLCCSLASLHSAYLRGPMDVNNINSRYNHKARGIGAPERRVCKLGDPQELRDKQIFKIAILNVDDEKERCISGFINENLRNVQWMKTGKSIINVFPLGYDKGTGIKRLSANTGFSTDEFCVIGDFDSDIPMFRAGGLSVAVGNASEEVQAAANVVCPPANADGVGQFIEEYFL